MRVIGVEPSEKMLGKALKKGWWPSFIYSRSWRVYALSDESIDMVFISMIFHHFRDAG